MFQRTLKVQNIRVDSPDTIAVDLVNIPVEGQQEPMHRHTSMTLSNLTPEEASDFMPHQVVTLTVS